MVRRGTFQVKSGKTFFAWWNGNGEPGDSAKSA
jgi:hypothetical protein